MIFRRENARRDQSEPLDLKDSEAASCIARRPAQGSTTGQLQLINLDNHFINRRPVHERCGEQRYDVVVKLQKELPEELDTEVRRDGDNREPRDDFVHLRGLFWDM